MKTDFALEQLGGPNFSGVFVGEHINSNASGFIKFFGNRTVTEVRAEKKGEEVKQIEETVTQDIIYMG